MFALSVARRTGDWKAGLGQACARLTYPFLRDEDEQGVHLRLVGVLLAGPMALGALAAPLLAQHLGFALVLALICGFIAAAWGIVVLLAAKGQLNVAGGLTLLLGSAALACTVSSAGLASPAMLALLALPAEAWWVTRSRRMLRLGAWLAGGAAIGAAAIGVLQLIEPAGAQTWHWAQPLGYLALVLLRADAFVPNATEKAAGASSLEELADCAVLRMKANGEVAGANARAEAELGLPVSHLAAGGFFERVHVPDRVAFLAALDKARREGLADEVAVRLRVPHETHGSTVRHFSLSFARRDEQTLFLMLRDREEFVELEHKAAAAMERADDLDVAKGRFLAAVSHELRTPLNAIIGFSEMMISGMAGPFADPRQREYVGIVRESGQHLLSVVNSILDVSKIESGTYEIQSEPFRFAEAVELCRSMMAVQAEAKQVALRVKIERGVGEICGDRRAVQQTLINLVANAIKFTPEGGSVTIGAHREGRWLRFWISDTGIGIAECDLDRLGQPFMQVRNDYTRQFEGAGLGLSIVKGLVALHEGSLSVASAPGEGTTVTVTLPVDGPKGNEALAGAEIRTMVEHGTQTDQEAYRRSA